MNIELSTEETISNETISNALLAAIEKSLFASFEEGVIVNVTADTQAEAYELRARSTSDGTLSIGFHKLAKKVRKAGRA